jgi:hypothetical protein
MMKNKLIITLFAVILVILGFHILRHPTTNQLKEMTEDSVIVEPPDTKITKYKGIWMPFLREVQIALNDIDNLKLDGINIVAIGIKVCKDEENDDFYVCEDENEIKNAINEFHKNGIKTFLILNPANPDSKINPNSPEGKGKILLDKLTLLVLNWSIISEKYGVEMFCPVNEPQMLAYKNDNDVSDWAQEILPKIREGYKGKIVFEVQGAKEHLYNLTGYDYIADGGLTCTNDIVDHPKWIEEMIDEEFSALKLNYPGLKYLFFNAGAFTGPDYYWWEPIAVENMKDNPQGWPEDFFTVSFESQADFYDMFFNRTWNEVDGYFLPVYKGWEYKNKPAEEIIKKWFNKNVK